MMMENDGNTHDILIETNQKQFLTNRSADDRNIGAIVILIKYWYLYSYILDRDTRQFIYFLAIIAKNFN